MLKTVLYIITVCSFYVAKAQKEARQGIVKDSLTNDGLPFANIGIKHTTKGTNTNPDGHFSIEVSPNDTLVVSYIGYATLTIPANEMDSVLYLSPQDRRLDGVTIRANASKTRVSMREKISNTNRKTHIIKEGSNQYAIYIPNEVQASGLFEYIAFGIKPEIRKNGRWESLIRIRVYENRSGYPAADILTAPIEVRAKKGAQQLRIDLLEYNVEFPVNGCFIGMDFIGYYDDSNRYIPYSSKNRPLDTYLEFALEADSKYTTYSKFFGTDWMETTGFASFSDRGKLLPIQAKFTAKIIFFEK